MYSRNQEKIVLHLIFFVVFIFQINTPISLRYAEIKFQLLLIALNILFFYGMIMYAKWVWEGIKIFQAFLKTLRAEVVLLLSYLVLSLIIKLTL